MAGFDFLTNHAHVMVCVAREPDTRLSEISRCVGIGERAVHRIVCELEAAGYLKRKRVGRRTVYELDRAMPLRHELEHETDIGTLLDLLVEPEGRPAFSASA